MHAQGQLLERTDELERLGGLIAAAQGGSGAMLIVEGEAGIGKSRLLEAARQQAEASGMLVLTARGGELERDFAYGVARQLFERPIADLPAPAREDVLGGAAAPAAGLLGAASDMSPPEADAAFVMQHALYWVTVNLSAQRPVLLVIDDLHWADLASLQWLAYLGGRLEGLPVGVALGWRTGEPGAPEDLLALLRADGRVDAITPGSLSLDACAQIVEGALGAGADRRFCEACRATSGGNPFFLGELVGTLASEGVAPSADAARRVEALSPHAVSRSALVRLSRLPDSDVALARAVAVLENDSELRLAAEVAGVDQTAAGAAVARLSAARILAPDAPLRFAHPILRTVVYEDLARPARAALHRRAARVLEDEDRADRAAVHLMSSDPAGDRQVVASLRAAASRALAQGVPASAVAMLGRALREPPAADERPDVLLELGIAARRAGDPAAPEHLRRAIERASSPAALEAGTTELATTLVYAGQMDEAIESLEHAIAALPDDDRERRLRLEGELLTLAYNSEVHNARLADRLRAVAEGSSGQTPAERALLATFAFQCVQAQRMPASAARALVDRAWSNGRLLEDRDDPGRATLFYCLMAHGMLDRAPEAVEIGNRVAAVAAERGAVSALAMAHAMRGRAAIWVGDLAAAEADFTSALHTGSLVGAAIVTHWSVAFFVMSLSLRGEFEAAERLLASHGLLDTDPPQGVQSSTIFLGRCRLRFDQARWTDARRDAEQFIARLRARGAEPVAIARRIAALASLQEGDRTGASEIAERQLAVARRFGLPSDIGIALATRGVIEGGEAGIESLREGARLLGDVPRPLEHAEVLVDLGAALRRANRRADAREPLRRALDIAQSCGARHIAERAHAELRACGARPRKLVLSGADALTTSERRVAELAAEGLKNREIAQTLFVTPKTVETHLRAIFRKLDITARTELPQALRPDQPAPAVLRPAVTQEAADWASADDALLATVLFTDIVRSTERAAELGDARWRELLARHDELVRAELERHRGREVKHTGDGFLATFDSATRAVRCACAIRERLLAIGVQIRAGIHTGECSLEGGDVRGLAVHAAARIVAVAEPGQVLVSGVVRALVAPGELTFGAGVGHDLEGVPGEWTLHDVTPIKTRVTP